MLRKVATTFGVQSWSLVVWRLLGLLCITIVAGYFHRPTVRPANPGALML